MLALKMKAKVEFELLLPSGGKTRESLESELTSETRNELEALVIDDWKKQIVAQGGSITAASCDVEIVEV